MRVFILIHFFDSDGERIFHELREEGIIPVINEHYDAILIKEFESVEELKEWVKGFKKLYPCVISTLIEKATSISDGTEKFIYM